MQSRTMNALPAGSMRWGSFDPRPVTVTSCHGDGQDGSEEPVVRPPPVHQPGMGRSMKIRSTMMRFAGAGMIAVAVVPWLGGGSASAAVNVYVAAKWDGTNSATSTVSQA